MLEEFTTLFPLFTDSYKLTHFNQYQDDVEGVYSYYESRVGAKYPFTLFFGLQYVLERFLSGVVVTEAAIDKAEKLVVAHMGSTDHYNREGWEYIVHQHGGRLPLVIKAVPEGTCVPVGNILMSVETTDPKCAWITNYIESLLTHIWYPSTVATLSKDVKNFLSEALERTGTPENINFMLHDFGYRGATSNESAAIGGAGHLVNFMGTDTLLAMALAADYYFADLATLAFSVPASEHSVMTALGVDGEYEVLQQLLDTYQTGILSVVADSYDIYKFTEEVIRKREQILARDGKFVLRPDSTTPTHTTPEDLVVYLVERLYAGFGGTVNEKGFKVLDPKVGVIWGDGIDPDGIRKIILALEAAGYSADNMVFGMGGGLLQKVNRDTQRFAFKCSAQKQGGVWVDIQKNPLDQTKKSKAGRLKLIIEDGEYKTVREDEPGQDILETVFKNGHLVQETTFDEIRERSNA